ncbi:MAG: hypothetical protein WCA56_15405, partial [Xanthobacteraceae bacterium]
GNDHGSYPQEPEFAPAEELIAPPATEPELTHAVADLDAAPRRAPQEAPVSAEAPRPLPEEPVRRRSTVRERAPVGGGEDALPPAQTQQPITPTPEPVVSESGDAAEGDRPRRTGWWSRRFAGG